MKTISQLPKPFIATISLIFLSLTLFFNSFTAQAGWEEEGGNIYYDDGGNVGIGTTSPESSLHVVSDIVGTIIKQASTLGGSGNYFEPLFPTLSLLRNSDSLAATLEVGNTDGSFYLSASDQLFQIFLPSENPIFTIKNSGYLGIGNDNPWARLDVSGPNNERVLRVAINNESAYWKDQISISSSLSTAYGIAFGGQGHHRGGIYAENTGGTGSAEGHIGIWARGGGNITLESGAVGIGTTHPEAKLDVDGDIKFSGNLLSDGDICIGNCGGIEMRMKGIENEKMKLESENISKEDLLSEQEYYKNTEKL